MNGIVRWAIGNTPAVNVMIIAVLVAGFFSFSQMRREVFPEFELEVILVTVPYPGASPGDCEKGVCQPVEEAIRSLDGIKRLVSIAREGGGYVLVELNSNVGDVQKVVTEIRSRVDRVTNFPDLAEDPQVEQITFRESAIRVAILGPKSDSLDAELQLREVAEEIRAELLDIKTISQAEIQGAKPYQIDVELSEDTLRKYGLTLSRVANILRQRNIEMPGGQLRADGQEILLRGKNRREIGEEIQELPVITQANGVVLKISDIGKVHDEFDDSSNINEVNGNPALVISIDRTADEDLLQIADAVHEYVDQKSKSIDPGYTLEVWGDTSIDVRDRMRMLQENGIQGLLFVFLLLALFLEFRLAFWVSLGIPICVFGAGIILLLTGQTLNMLSMFAFLMALGIVVDDAIVVGENIYAHRKMGKDFYTAAVDGTLEVLPSVTTAIFTTIVAFMPFFFVEGVMGKFIAVMPVAIIAMLAISLVEAAAALPCHLADGEEDEKKRPSLPARFIHACSETCGRGMDFFGDRIYLPCLSFLLRYPFLGVGLGIFPAVWDVRISQDRFREDQSVSQDGQQSNLGSGRISGRHLGGGHRCCYEQIEMAARRASQMVHNEENGITMTEEELQQSLQSRTPNGPVKLTFRQVGQLTAQGAMGSTGNGAGQRCWTGVHRVARLFDAFSE